MRINCDLLTSDVTVGSSFTQVENVLHWRLTNSVFEQQPKKIIISKYLFEKSGFSHWTSVLIVCNFTLIDWISKLNLCILPFISALMETVGVVVVIVASNFRQILNISSFVCVRNFGWYICFFYLPLFTLMMCHFLCVPTKYECIYSIFFNQCL